RNAKGMGVMREGWHQTIRAFAESASDAILATDDRGSILYANPPAIKLFQTEGELVGRSLQHLLTPDTPDDSRYPSRTASASVHSLVRERSPFEITGADGEKRAVTVSIETVASDGDAGFIVLARNLDLHAECERRASEATSALEAVLEMAPVGIHTFDSERRIKMANKSFLDLIGRSRDEVIGHEWSELVVPEQRPVFAVHWEALQRGDAIQHAPYALVHRTGRRIQVLFSAFPDCNEEGELQGARGLVTDITPRWEAERKIHDIESDYKRLFSMNLAGVYRATMDGILVDCNDTCAHTLGYESATAYLGSSPPSPWLDDDERQELTDRLITEGSLMGVESGMVRYDGVPVWVQQNLSLVTTPDGNRLIEGTMFDITQKRLAEEKVAYQAHYDGLTGLANPVLFEKRVTAAMEASNSVSRHVALMFIDLDHFKSVNDTLGHNVGNQLLQLVAFRLQRALREGDTVARMGGDEFIVVLGALQKPEDAERVAQKLLDHISRPYLLDGKEFIVTASIGIAVYPEDGSDTETLMRNADVAMYRAKESGRNAIAYGSHAKNEKVIQTMSLENDLRRAIEKREFVLHYQPQVEATTRKIHALEALIRWNHPERGLIMPNDFIPVAEKSNLIVQIGDWVLRTACETLASWNSHSSDLRIAVNLSPRQFQDESFLRTVRSVLDDTGIEPERLELEVTEGTAMQNPEVAMQILSELKSMGVRLAIDDFGTGYSSLSYLTQFPIDCLKIDQGFIRDIELNGNVSTIISALITLAHKLELGVIAEGVETCEQSKFLIDNHCEQMQGFLFSRPQPIDAIETLLQNGLPN
ncbi:MAG: EAL domain-containing protein, partial [Acidobacteria bacterium]|nr:EAL domain-containing protein [Acidobacteriota bacterium]